MRFWLAVLSVVSVATMLPATASADARDDKVGVYIEVYNMFTSRFDSQRSRYRAVFGTLDPAATPCASAQNAERELFHGQDSSGTVADFRRRLRRRPSLPQDALVNDMLDAATVAAPTWNEVFDYYHRDVDSTDACALGNTLHGRITAAWAKYFTAEAQLIGFLREETNARQARELASIEREFGRNFRFFHATMLGETMTLQELYGAEPFDVEAFSRAVESLAAHFGEIRPRVSTAPAEASAGLNAMHYSSFLVRLDNFIGSARAFVTAVRSNTRVDRAANDFERGLSDVIRTSNGMRFDERVR